jgi:SAM-dependent methyltransferase
MRSRTIHVTPLSAPTVTAPVASTPMAGGDGNHDYLFAIYEQLRAERGPIRALDFGCGSGTLIIRARERGFDDFLGAETYYGDQAIYAQSMPSIAAETANWIVRVADDGKLPFPDQHFDFVCSNEVFEHVHNLGPVLDELARVTNPGGVHVHLFPTREKVIEAHLGVPLYPQLPARWRERYVRWFHGRGIAAFSDPTPLSTSGGATSGRSCGMRSTTGRGRSMRRRSVDVSRFGGGSRTSCCSISGSAGRSLSGWPLECSLAGLPSLCLRWS